MANPPWGKNIGGKEDGAHIVRNLVHHFAPLGRTFIAVLVSKSCFRSLVSYDNDVRSCRLVDGAFGAIGTRPTQGHTHGGAAGGNANDSCKGIEAAGTQGSGVGWDPGGKEQWALLHHADIGLSVFMVMGWADVARHAEANGVVYSSGFAGGNYNAPGMPPRRVLTN